MVDSKKYVVLDVETNGLSSIRDDLLSISLYKPDDKKIYDRYLPLELNEWVKTTWINGITEEMLEDKSPLTQEEFDSLVNEFELDKRTILTYGNVDEKFIKKYLLRKSIQGFEKLTFYNFKHDIISSRFSEGNITKDNLCAIYGIENINDVHNGLNDCILEWKLFKKMNGNKLIIIKNSVNEFNSEYIIPASYLQNYTNFRYCINNFPKIDYEMSCIKSFHIESKELRKFDTNISGMTIEHLINTMLNVKDMNEETILFQTLNRQKLKRIGVLPSNIHQINVLFNKDGTIDAVNKEDKKQVDEINKVTLIIKKEIVPLIEYINKNIFKNKKIMSQELVVNRDDNVMAKCDLSTDDAILEIKTFNSNIDKFKYQLYYESKGRKIYILQTFWLLDKGLNFKIFSVKQKKYIEGEKNLEEQRNSFEKMINNRNIKVLNYDGYNQKVKLTCTNCDNVWTSSYDSILKYNQCPICNPKHAKLENESIAVSEEKKQAKRFSSYQYKVALKSDATIQILSYTDSKEKVTAKCLLCGYKWTDDSADHLLEKCHCPMCKNRF